MRYLKTCSPLLSQWEIDMAQYIKVIDISFHILSQRHNTWDRNSLQFKIIHEKKYVRNDDWSRLEEVSNSFHIGWEWM